MQRERKRKEKAAAKLARRQNRLPVDETGRSQAPSDADLSEDSDGDLEVDEVDTDDQSVSRVAGDSTATD